MPGYTPETQFEQYVVDSFEAMKPKVDKIEPMDDRILILEQDRKWYKKIFVFVWGVIGGGLVTLIHRLTKG